MCDENPRLIEKFITEAILEDGLLDVCIKRGQRVVHQVDVSVCVDGSSKTNTCLLATGKVDALFTDLSRVTSRHYLKVTLELANLDDALVLVLVFFSDWLAERRDVLTDGLVLDPWGLLRVADALREADRGRAALRTEILLEATVTELPLQVTSQGRALVCDLREFRTEVPQVAEKRGKDG